jgi:hypothetical protein
VKFDPLWLLAGLNDEQVKGVITVGWRGLIVVHILWACGWTSYIGLQGGFAHASDLAAFKAETKDRRVKELKTELLDAKAKQCSVNGQAWRLYYSAYNELRAEYYMLTNREAPDPPCDNFK